MRANDLLKVVDQVNDLDKRVAALEDILRPSANMDASANAITLDALPAKVREALSDAGYETPMLLQKMTDEDLLKLQGIGPAALKQIRQALGQ